VAIEVLYRAAGPLLEGAKPPHFTTYVYAYAYAHVLTAYSPFWSY
jgi:hypothetical protein